MPNRVTGGDGRVVAETRGNHRMGCVGVVNPASDGADAFGRRGRLCCARQLYARFDSILVHLIKKLFLLRGLR